MEHLFNSQHLTDEQGNKLFMNEESGLAFQIIDPDNHLLCVRKGLKIPDDGHLIIPDTAVIKQTPYKITRIASGAFKYEEQLRRITLGQELREIGANAFEGCTNLRGTLDIPGNLCSIGEDAFAGTALTGIEGGGRLTEFADGIFAGCTRLTSIIVPTNIKKIGFGAFADCNRLETIQFGANVNRICEAAFYGCNRLKRICYTGTIADWCRIIFDTPDANPLCHAQEFHVDGLCPTLLEIPVGTTQMHDHAFYKCRQFSGEIQLGNDLASIGSLAFYGCTNIKTVRIGAKVRRINHRAFEGCHGITSIICESNEPPAVPANFRGILLDNCTLYIPQNAINRYQVATAWNAFKHIRDIQDFYENKI